MGKTLPGIQMQDVHPDINEVRQLLRESEMPISEVAAQTGVSRRWIGYLQSDDYGRDPGANRLWKLLNFLRGNRAD